MDWHRAGTFGLLGWYLMLPPGPPNNPNLSAPISRWAISSSFDTADDCGKVRLANAGRYSYPPEGYIKNEHPTEKDEDAECIATDDPRLKGN
jgi:hypothetical protein